MKRTSKPAKQYPFGLCEARYRTNVYAPYLYSHVASLIPVERPGMGTLAVDEYMRLYYDPAVFAEREIDECSGMILHEALHVLLRHFERAEAHVGAAATEGDWKRWNIAADLVVNQVVRECRVPIGKDWLIPEKFGLEPNLSVEQYYDQLPQQQGKPKPGSGEGRGGGEGGGQDVSTEPSEPPEPGRQGGGSGADGRKRPWDDPPPDQCDTPGMDAFNREMLERDVAQRVEGASGRGDVPGYLTRFAQQKLHPTVDPWKVLPSLVRFAAHHENGRGDYTWKKFPRRSPPGGLRLPAQHKPMPRVVVGVDTSGSMGTADLEKGLGLIAQGLRNVPAEGLTVVAGDTCIRSTQKVFRAQDVKLAGGGGTDMGRLIEEAAKLRPAPNAIIVVTDGDTGWPRHRLQPAVVACLTRKHRADRVPDWITKLVMEDK